MIEVPNYTPEGYLVGYEMGELEPMERRLTYHPERLHMLFYDDVAHNLSEGATVSFPLGEDRHDRPVGIAFKYEEIGFMAVLPEPMADDPHIILCTKEPATEAQVHRAARLLSFLFVMEYKAFYSKAIKQSKAEKGID